MTQNGHSENMMKKFYSLDYKLHLILNLTAFNEDNIFCFVKKVVLFFLMSEGVFDYGHDDADDKGV